MKCECQKYFHILLLLTEMAHRTERSSVRLGSTRFDRVEQGMSVDKSSRTRPLFGSRDFCSSSVRLEWTEFESNWGPVRFDVRSVRLDWTR